MLFEIILSGYKRRRKFHSKSKEEFICLARVWTKSQCFNDERNRSIEQLKTSFEQFLTFRIKVIIIELLSLKKFSMKNIGGNQRQIDFLFLKPGITVGSNWFICPPSTFTYQVILSIQIVN